MASRPSEESPQANHKRSSRACRRCRRMRIKCRNDGGSPPCQTCRQGGHECTFPDRGEPDRDRTWRRSIQSRGTLTPQTSIERNDSIPSITTESAHGPTSLTHPNASPILNLNISSSAANFSAWDILLPPLNEVIEGVQTFSTSYFQLGFLPPTLFVERLRKNPRSISPFLLLAILSVSARFTPSLVKRYKGGNNATDHFLHRADTLVPDYIYNPCVNSVQGFFLISIAEWGKEDKNRSSIHMGIAVRMAGILRWHREETYQLPEAADADQIILMEVARRTFWMLENHENIYSGHSSLIPFSVSDITTLLPCDEHDFSFGIRPKERAALMGTRAASENPALLSSPSRSLFATLIQAHNLWGQVSRIASISNQNTELTQNDYRRLAILLQDWEDELPTNHQWSIWNLRGYKAEGLDLAYLSVVMVVRLSNIILRRGFLNDIFTGKERLPTASTSNSTSENRQHNLLGELYANVLTLQEQIRVFFELRSPHQGYPALITFCVYISGLCASHLFRRPELCQEIAPHAEEILQQSMKILNDLQHAWPLAKRWSAALRQAYYQRSAPSATPDEVGQTSSPPQTSPSSQMFFGNELPTDAILAGFGAYQWDDMFSNITMEDST